MTTFERIKNLSKKFGKNLQDVAEEAGLGKNAIYKWQHQNPKGIDLAAVAKVLHTTTDYLLGNTSNPNPVGSDSGISWLDLDMPYGGKIPDDLKGMYRALAEQYVKDHPESLKKD